MHVYFLDDQLAAVFPVGVAIKQPHIGANVYSMTLTGHSVCADMDTDHWKVAQKTGESKVLFATLSGRARGIARRHWNMTYHVLRMEGDQFQRHSKMRFRGVTESTSWI